MGEKPFKTIKEQISILKDRGLTFLSEEHAESELLRYGYYEIINGYKDSFLEEPRVSVNEKYIDGTTFEQILALFQFDKNLQHSIFKATIEFERIIKTAISYAIGEKYGSNQKDYLIRENYKSGRRSRYQGKSEYEIDQLFRKFNNIAKDEVEPFKHYREEHGNIPPWILLKGATFGNIRKFYTLQKSDVKNKIISIIFNIPETFVAENDEIKNLFSDTLALCHMFRNRSAHNGRIYNYFSKKATMRYSPLLHPEMNVTEAEYRLGLGKNDIPTLMVALRMIDSSYPFIYIKVGLEFEIEKYNEIYPNELDKLLKLMCIDKYNIKKVGIQLPDHD